MKSRQAMEAVKSDLWAVAEGAHEDNPLFIRYRRGCRQVTDFSGYPLLLQITWFFEDLDDVPSDSETEAMDQFEERIIAAYEHDFHAVLTAVITTQGKRQWFFYTADVDECGERLAEMPQEEAPYPIELDAEEDPTWSFLRQNILAGCKDHAA